MDIGPAIWLSSVTGALLFFSGGRLWNKLAGKGERSAPPARDDGSALARAEHEAAAARQARDEASRALDTELTRATALQGELSSRGREVEGLRARVADLEARAVARDVRMSGPPPPIAAPKAGQRLEEAIEGRLDALRLRRGSCESAILADVRGLLLASCGDTTHDEALAVAASMITETSEHMRQILPLGAPLEIRLMDVNHAVFTARWLRPDDQEKFIVGTIGHTGEKADARADAIEASISDLLRAPHVAPARSA
jgi:hypothetical protein